VDNFPGEVAIDWEVMLTQLQFAELWVTAEIFKLGDLLDREGRCESLLISVLRALEWSLIRLELASESVDA
jgi:hypothetical protein